MLCLGLSIGRQCFHPCHCESKRILLPDRGYPFSFTLQVDRVWSRKTFLCVADELSLNFSLPEESIVRVRKLQKGKARWRDVVKSKVFAKSDRPRRPQQNHASRTG